MEDKWEEEKLCRRGRRINKVCQEVEGQKKKKAEDETWEMAFGEPSGDGKL